MKVRVVVAVAMFGLVSGVFADSTPTSWAMDRTISTLADVDVSNPKGEMWLTLSGAGFSDSHVQFNEHLNFHYDNSANLGPNPFTSGGIHENDSGDTSFQGISSFVMQTEGDHELGFLVVVTLSDGQSITVGAWPTYTKIGPFNVEGPGNPPNYNTTYTYPEVANFINSNPRKSFTVKYYVYWDFEESGDWELDGPFTYNFNYSPDTSPPALTEVNGTSSTTFGKAAAHTWTFQASDPRGVGSVSFQPEYSPDGVNYQSFGAPNVVDAHQSALVEPSFPVSLTQGNGYYRVTATALNADDSTTAPNHASTIQSSVYGLDTQGPAFASAASASFSSNGTIQVTWGAASDGLSGLPANPYQVSYTVNGGSPAVLTPAGSSALSAALPFANNLYGATVVFSVAAADQAGNTTVSTASVSLPPLLAVTAAVNPLSDNTNMQVDLHFNLTPKALKAAFTSIVLTRTSSVVVPSVSLPSLTLPLSSISADGSGAFVPGGGWSADAQGNAVYADVIPVVSGAGHKTWQYQPQPSPWIGSPPVAAAVSLPNHQGSVTMSLIDINGNAYDPSNPAAFQLGTDRKARLIVQAADIDRDHWTFEVDRATQTKTQTATLTNYARISGNTASDYPYNGGYAPQTVLVTLSEGINNLETLWTEGDTNPVFQSDALSVTVVKSASGTYQVQVASTSGDDLPTDGSAVLTRPGQPLQFSLAGAGTLTYSWDFGDGTTAGNQAQVTHAYDQAVGQTGDSTPYLLSITVSDGTTTQVVPLQVTVQDTREGTLYKNETWHGDHLVTGVVEIPSGCELDLATNSGALSSVTMSGGLGAGYQQGIVVDAGATLSVADNIAFSADSSNGWNTIKVLGSASFGAADLQGASQAISVGPGGRLRLNGTNVHNNRVGLHFVGTSDSQVNAASITGNALYGIQENAGGRPLLSGTSVTGNLRNYYSWDQGLLTIAQINALNAQATTPNSGDANTGTNQ